MDALELARWTRFAAKGGIGKCTAVHDCVAEQAEDLMFLKDDVITVLMQMPELEGIYLGYCEGVVGRFNGSDVQFHSKLKKPVMTKRSSLTTPKPNANKAPSPTVIIDSSSGSDGGTPKTQLVHSPTTSGSVYTTHSSLPSSRSQSLSHSTITDNDPLIPPSMSSPSTSSAAESVLATPVQPLPHIDDRRKNHYATTARATHSVSPQLDAEPVEEPFLRPIENVHRLRQPGGPRSSSATSSIPSFSERSFDSDPTARISISSDGEVGIGLSLLQDLVNGVDGWSSPSSGHSSVRESPVQELADRASSSASPDSTAEAYPHSLPTTAPLSISPRARANSRTAPSPALTQRSQSTTGEDWENAIYDDYRYSRYSSTSKVSRFSHTTSSSPSSVVPPLPSDSARPSMDRTMSTDSRYSFQTQSSQRSMAAARSTTLSMQSKHESAADLRALRSKDRPPPLDFRASPLLHNAFLSPQPSPFSPSSGVFAAAAASLPSSPSTGAASVLRQTLEEGSDPTRRPLKKDAISKSRGIVMEDDVDDDDEDAGRDVFSDSPRSESPQPISPPPPLLASTPSNQLHQNGSGASNSSTDATAPPPLRTRAQTTASEPPQSMSPSSPNHPLPPPSVVRSASRPPDLRRPPGGWKMEETSARTSLFLPHPGSPRAPASPSKPLYTRPPSLHPQQNPYAQLPPNSAIVAIRQAMASARYGPNGETRLTTIYGRCDVDLAESMGPVPISFAVEPFPDSHVAMKTTATSWFAATSPLNIPKGSGSPMSSSPLTTEFAVDSAVITTEPSSVKVTGNVIPRPGFNPKAPGSRPRSRSFSGFTNTAALADGPLPYGRSREEGSEPFRNLRAGSINATSDSNSPLQSSSPSMLLPPRSTVTTHHPSHAPSPLSLPHNNTSIASRTPSFKTPASPLLASSLSASSSRTASPSSSSFASSSSLAARRPGPNKLRKVASTTAINLEKPSSPLAIAPPQFPIHTASGDVLSPTSPSFQFPSRSLHDGMSGHGSFDTNAQSGGGQSMSGRSSPLTTPINRGPSLRSKLSLPALRSKNNGGTSARGDDTGNPSHGKELGGGDLETVQVKDMDFELIRPTIPLAASSGGRDSEDSAFTLPEIVPMTPDLGLSLLRVDSPSMSVSSSGPSSTLRSPSAFSDQSSPLRTPTSDSDTNSMEAHRQRELKWMSLMPTIPASQARKNKKIRRLLLEGVPSSVRYLVWCRLSDSKAREMPGVYAQLLQRDKVPVFADLVADAHGYFPDQLQLHTEGGPLVSLLQAYLTMVPDIQYSVGLTCVAGHLLLLSPEEDAFWIFVSIMDTHLRPYFSSSAIQMEVDAALFSKAVESNDSIVGRKIYVDMGISPAHVCRRWFTSLFAGSLPVEYLHRVWDIFFYEGIPFLFRVGLALICCNRRQILESTREESVFDILFHPPPTSLPPTTETFISMVFSMKLKDDDIRKQRVKMEAQVKRQTQMRPRALSTLGGQSGTTRPSAAISLPRS